MRLSFLTLIFFLSTQSLNANPLMFPTGAIGQIANSPLIVVNTASASRATDTNSYTIPALNFGTASNDRYILVGVIGCSSISNTINSITIGGVAATEVYQISGNVASGYSGGGFFIALVPTGTSGDIAISYASTQTRIGIGVWSIRGLRSIVPTESFMNYTNTPASGNINITGGGAVFGMAYNTGTTNNTWANITSNFDLAIVDNPVPNAVVSGASQVYPQGSFNQSVHATNTASSALAGMFISLR